MSTLLRFEHCHSNNAIDLDGIKFVVWNDLGIRCEFGDFVSTDLYLFAELIAEFKPRSVSIAFCTALPEAFDACKEAARAAGIAFFCTAG